RLATARRVQLSGVRCGSRIPGCLFLSPLSRRVTVSPHTRQGQGAPTSWNLSKIGVALRMRTSAPSRRPAIAHAERRRDARQEDGGAIVQALRERPTAVPV